MKTVEPGLLLRPAVGSARNGPSKAVGLRLVGSLTSCRSLLAPASRGDSGDDLSGEPWEIEGRRVTPALETEEG